MRYMDESLVHTSFLLHDHTFNSMLGNIVRTNHNIGRGLLMIDIEAIIRHASEKLKYCFEN